MAVSANSGHGEMRPCPRTPAGEWLEDQDLAMITPLILLPLLTAGSAAQPAFLREPDGSIVIEQTIEAEPVPLEEATDGLVADFERPSQADRPRNRRSRPEASDRDVERAYEEAVDMAKTAAATDQP
jgi:hypothetical protein